MKEHTSKYFDLNQESPHMLIAAKIKSEMKEKVPAIVHVDNTCRVQTVSSDNNKIFRQLLKEFYKLSNCPVLLNTSFNIKGQPIVNTPEQAIKCYLSTNIDFLVIGNYYIEKK